MSIYERVKKVFGSCEDYKKVHSALEDEFDIEIPDEEAQSIATVEQAVDYVTTKKKTLTCT